MWLDASVEAQEGLMLSSPQWETREHMAFFRGVLEKDATVELAFGDDTLAPYPVTQ